MMPKGNVKDWGSVLKEEEEEEEVEVIPVQKTSFINRKRYIRRPKAK